jgi:hypothetical protein
MLAESLVHDGYLEHDHELENREQAQLPWYSVTLTGKEIARASAARRISRKTACTALHEFIGRVHLVNKNRAYLYTVSRVAVFGSFLQGADRLGDVDVAIDLSSRIAIKGNWWKTFQKHAWKSGRSFRSFEDEIDWPRREVILKLKARKRSISIHSWFCFIEMEKPAGFQYRVLLGNADGVRGELERAELGRAEDAMKYSSEYIDSMI